MMRAFIGLLVAASLAHPVAAQLIDPALAEAMMLCNSRVTRICTTNPPIVCGYDGEWDKICPVIARAFKTQAPPPTLNEQQSLEFTRDLANRFGAYR